MLLSSPSVSGCADVRGGVGNVIDGRLMLRSACSPGMLLMVVGLNDVHGLI